MAGPWLVSGPAPLKMKAPGLALPSHRLAPVSSSTRSQHIGVSAHKRHAQHGGVDKAYAGLLCLLGVQQRGAVLHDRVAQAGLLKNTCPRSAR